MRRYLRKFKTFFYIESDIKKIFIKAYLYTGISRLALLTISFKKINSFIKNTNSESSYEINNDEHSYAQKVKWILENIDMYTPWESKCLVQALTAQKILREKKMVSTIYLGVNNENNKMTAHAWTRCGSLIVTGAKNKAAYTMVAKFSNV